MELINDGQVLDLIFPELPIEDLLHLCKTNKRFHRLCQSDSFWETKVKREYPDLIDRKDQNESWKDFYFYLANPWTIGVGLMKITD